MILKKVIMHNFGVYAGTNEFDFQGKKPVVLIGGMNGRGKTTFLEAVLIGLYGSNSFAYTESKFKSYGQYLRSYVNRSDGTLETFIELTFALDNSDEELYHIRREWDANGKRVREKISVKKNNQDNAFLTDNWPMFVENILPSALSNFFFFDGEKIAELAVENTNQKMKESIKALLGINVLDLLQKDLGRIITKLSENDSDNHDLKLLEELRQKKDQAYEDLKTSDINIERQEKTIEKLQNELEMKNNEYAIRGGDIVEQRHELVRQRSELIAAKENHQDSIREMAGGILPLMLVRKLVKNVQNQAELEQSYKMSRMTTEKIDSLFNKFVKEHPEIETEISKFVQYVRQENEAQQGEEIYGLSDNAVFQIAALNNSGMISAKEKVRSLTSRKNECQSKIDEIDNYLSVDIDEKELNRIYKQIKKLELQIAEEEVVLENEKQIRSTLNGAAIIAESEFNKATEQILSNLETMDDDNRTVKYAHMAIEIINAYKIRLQQNKTEKLAETMTDCYRMLANKKNLIYRVVMDPVSLDLHYLDSNLKEVEKKTLSAGEKQLMVISLLWALAICSKKKLPVIIDTPLSRLDSSHREALITTYFPNASEQTIILSTDSEIDHKYYDLMKPNVGDEFTLIYDDDLQKTAIQRGYLF